MISTYQPRHFSEETAKILGIICKNSLNRLKSSEFGIDIIEPEVAYTIATVFFEEAFRELANEAHRNGGEARLKIYELMTIGVDLRESDNGEKSGNMNIIMIPGAICKQLIKDDGFTEQQ